MHGILEWSHLNKFYLYVVVYGQDYDSKLKD
jgi:hypothetical protein